MVRSTADYDTQRLAGDHARLDQHHRCRPDARCVCCFGYSYSLIYPRVTGSTAPFTAAQNHNLNYRSGMLQSWNKFCFTTGYIEVSVVLPGQDANSAGYVSLPLYALFVFPLLLRGWTATLFLMRGCHPLPALQGRIYFPTTPVLHSGASGPPVVPSFPSSSTFRHRLSALATWNDI